MFFVRLFSHKIQHTQDTAYYSIPINVLVITDIRNCLKLHHQITKMKQQILKAICHVKYVSKTESDQGP